MALPKEEKKIVAYALLIGLILWVIDAAIESITKPEVQFIPSVLTDVSMSEFVERSIILVFCVLLGFALAHFLGKQRKLSREREGLIRAVSDATNGIAITDPLDRFIYVNEAYARIFGSAVSSIVGKSCRELTSSSDDAGCFDEIHRALHDPSIGVFDGELSIPRREGGMVLVELRAKAFWTEGEYQGFICVMTDITKRQQIEYDLVRSNRFLNTIFDSIHDPFIILDRRLRIVRVNKAYADLKGHTAEALIGRSCYEATRSASAPCGDCVVQKTLASGDPCAKEKMVTQDDGTEEWFQIFTYPIKDDESTVTHVIEYIRNITAQKRTEQALEHSIRKLEIFSSTDVLTGLLNRRVLLARLQAEIDRAQRYDSSFALLFCDLDYFKEINDTYGHQAGDVVLREIAAVLTKSVRTCDIVGRYGGDEFIVVLPETSLEGAQDVAERIRQSIGQARLPFDRSASRLSVSIGITGFVPTDSAADDLIARIDNALYASKKAGKDRIYTIP
ncbi:MAG: hypothetical protein OHK006_01080 [Thermodesulfovibrionales bacterium]